MTKTEVARLNRSFRGEAELKPEELLNITDYGYGDAGHAVKVLRGIDDRGALAEATRILTYQSGLQADSIVTDVGLARELTDSVLRWAESTLAESASAERMPRGTRRRGGRLQKA